MTALAVLQVVHGWPPESVGGAELCAANLHGGLLALGVRATVFTAAPSRDGRRLAVEDEGPVCRVRPGPARSFSEGFVRRDVEDAFAAFVARHRPDVVLLHHLAHLSLGLPRIAARSGARVLFALHDYWLACPRGQLIDRNLERCAEPEVGRCAWCLAGQASLGPVASLAARVRLPGSWRGRLRAGLGRATPRHARAALRERALLVAAAVRRVDRFLSPSRDLAARMAVLGLPRDRTEVFPLGLVQPVRPLPAPGPGPVRFLFAGALIPTKGPHLLVEAFARLPAGAATLVLAGPRVPLDLDPSYAERLASRVAEVPGAILLPPYPPGDAAHFLGGGDVLVVPSLWEENSPLVVREARAAGLRILASRRGGIPEIAPQARFFEPEARGGLARALAAEVREGRRRDPPATWEDPEAQATRLLSVATRTPSCRE